MKTLRFLLHTWLCLSALIGFNGCFHGCDDNVLGPVPDRTPPKVSFVSLQDNSTVARLNQPIIVKAEDPFIFTSPLGSEQVSGMAKVELFVSGHSLGVDTKFPWEFIWDTRQYADGNYILTATAYDSAGNVGTARVTVRLDNTIIIKEIKVTNTGDGLGGPLEIEVHLFEAATNRFVACAGEGSGLSKVDASDLLYEVDGYFQKSDREPIAWQNWVGKTVYFEVIENDVDACPNPNRGSGTSQDDLVGKSGNIEVTNLEQPQTFQFDKVTHLKLQRGRTN